jgi:ParB family chromosome partitioning protein
MSDQFGIAVSPSATAPDPRAETDVIATPVVVAAAPPVNSSTLIPIVSISTGRRRRALREDSIADLIRSIFQIGIQQPITVAQVADDETAFELIAGLHRLEACRRLKLTEIPAIVATLRGDERLLWELDENLCRGELTALELAEHLLERKELYERLHPETRQHVAGAHAANAAMSRGDATADSAVVSFGTDTAKKTGIAPRTIRVLTSRAKNISETARDRIRDNPKIADNGSELDALASLSRENQERVLDLVDAGECPSVRAAKRKLPEATAEEPSAAIGSLPSADASIAPEESADFALDEGHRQLIDLLFKAALQLNEIPDEEKIVELLRRCGLDVYADHLRERGHTANAEEQAEAA